MNISVISSLAGHTLRHEALSIEYVFKAELFVQEAYKISFSFSIGKKKTRALKEKCSCRWTET